MAAARSAISARPAAAASRASTGRAGCDAVELRPRRSASATRPAGAASARPEHDQHPASRTTCAATCDGARAQRHADPDLARLPRDGVGSSRRRGRPSPAASPAPANAVERPATQPLVAQRARDALVERGDVEHRRAPESSCRHFAAGSRRSTRRGAAAGCARRRSTSPMPPASNAGTKICGSGSSRTPWYLLSATTPTISMGVGVPGFDAEADVPADRIASGEVARARTSR